MKDEFHTELEDVNTSIESKADKVGLVGVNILPYPYEQTGTFTDNGLTYTLEDGVISLSGSSISNKLSMCKLFEDTSGRKLPIKSTKYIFHAKITNITTTETILAVKVSNRLDSEYDSTRIVKLMNGHAEMIIDNSDGLYDYIQGIDVSNRGTFNNDIIKIQLEEGDVAHEYCPYCITNRLEDLRETKVTAPKTATVGQVLAVKAVDGEGKPTEWQTAANGDMPVYTLAEYERVKDTIPVGTKFAISDDEGGDDPTPTPSGNDSIVQWFVIDSAHYLEWEYDKLFQTTLPATGNYDKDYIMSHIIISSSTISLYAIQMGANSWRTQTIYHGTQHIDGSVAAPTGYVGFIGLLKSDVELYNIQQITL